MISSKELKNIIDIISEEVPMSKCSFVAICFIYINIYDRSMTYIYDKDMLYKDDNLYKTAKSMCENISKEKATKLNEYIERLDLEELQEMVFELLIGYYPEERYFNDSASEELADLAYEVLNVDGKGHIVYDMGSGNGYFLANVIKRANDKKINLKDVIGQEINVEKAQISQMALDVIYPDESRPIIKIGNVLDDFNYPYTRSFVFPPFGMRQLLNDKSRKSKVFPKFEFTNRNTCEWIFIDQMISGISGDWKAVALTTGRALFNDADKEYRKMLIEKGLLEGIIELPNGSLNFSNVKVYMLIFSKNNEKVKLLDASNVIEEPIKRYNKVKLPVDKIIRLYRKNDVKTKEVNEIKDANNITPSILLMNVEKIRNGVQLSELAEVFTGNQYTLGVFEKNGMLTEEPTGYKILTSSDIEDGAIKWSKLHSIKYEETKFDKYAVKKNDVIVTSKSSKVKIAVIDKEPKEKVLVTGGMIVIRPEINKINPTYLKMFLDSEQGQLVLKSIQKGMTIVTMNAKDLSKILIPMINIDKQEEKAREYNDKLTTLYALKNEINKIEDSLKNFFSFNEEEED